MKNTTTQEITKYHFVCICELATYSKESTLEELAWLRGILSISRSLLRSPTGAQAPLIAQLLGRGA